MLAFPVLTALGLWFFWLLPGWAVFAITAITLVVGVALFPYMTKFDLKDEVKDHDN